ncbi:MAG: hypothetical protein ACYS8S_04575 [Planctomycetota bacterium]
MKLFYKNKQVERWIVGLNFIAVAAVAMDRWAQLHSGRGGGRDFRDAVRIRPGGPAAGGSAGG